MRKTMLALRRATLLLPALLIGACLPGATPATAPPRPPAPSAARPGATLLPAPLYVLEQGQIWRLERDGATRHQVTFEAGPISAFDLRPADGALVYLIGNALPLGGTRTLVALDASGRSELLSGPLGAPRLDPAGDVVAFRRDRPLGDGPYDPTGVWLIARHGGPPTLLQADTPPDAQGDRAAPAKSYTPDAWSPDGARLLIGSVTSVGEDGQPMITTAADGATVRVREACCGAATWSADGAALLLASGQRLLDGAPGLWRVDAGSGAAARLLPPTLDDHFVLTDFPRPRADGAADVFLMLTSEAPELNPAVHGRLVMTHVGGDGALTPLRPDDAWTIEAARWAPDGSGAAVLDSGSDPAGQLLWLPSDGGPAVALAASGADFAWGQADARPSPRACEQFTPLVWQPVSSRHVLPAVAEVQRRLLALGYALVGAADGLYTDQTRAAVAAFQRARGLPAAGNVDCATWQALLDAALGAP